MSPPNLDCIEYLDFLKELELLEVQKDSKNNRNNKEWVQFGGLHRDTSPIDIKPKTAHKPLSLRPDVMNKNIFRAIRKQCKMLFNSSTSLKKNFLLDITKFSERLLSFTQINWQQIQGFHRDNFTKYLGAFVSACKLKKTLKRKKEDSWLNSDSLGDPIEAVNSLFYKYSHRVFHHFISIPEVQVIIQIIFEKCSIPEIISSNATLRANAEEYKIRMQRLKEKTHATIPLTSSVEDALM